METIAVVKTSNFQYALLTSCNCKKICELKSELQKHKSRNGILIGGIYARYYYKASWRKLKKYL